MTKNNFIFGMITLLSLSGLQSAYANVSVPMDLVDADGQTQSVGTVTLADTPQGLLVTPNLQGLPAGVHGFHVHIHPDCAKHGDAAGSHLDPKDTKKHLGPYENGHLGDLPVLIVDQNGRATLPVLAPRLHLSNVKHHALMIHAGGDNYSDQPEKLGGGGSRIACGVIGSK